jgi:hypothetical protein
VEVENLVAFFQECVLIGAQFGELVSDWRKDERYYRFQLAGF